MTFRFIRYFTDSDTGENDNFEYCGQRNRDVVGTHKWDLLSMFVGRRLASVMMSTMSCK